MMLSASLSGSQLEERFADRFAAPNDGVVKTLGAATSSLDSSGVLLSTSPLTAAGSTNDLVGPIAPAVQETASGTSDADTLISYASEGELIGRSGNDTFVVAPDTYAVNDDVLARGGSGDDTFWILGGQATVKGGKGYDVVFVGDATATVSGVEEVWVRDPETWVWTLSEGRSQQVTNVDDPATPVLSGTTNASLTANFGTLAVPLSVGGGGGAALSSLATGPLDGDLTGDSVLDASDLDVLLGYLDDLKANTANVAFGNVRNGVTAREDASGNGFIMFSADPIRSRFSNSAFHAQQADHFVAVQHIDGQWYYHNNEEPLTAFTPETDDVLFTEIDFTANTATKLEGRAGVYEGIGRCLASLLSI